MCVVTLKSLRVAHMSLSTLSLSFGSSALTCLQDQLLQVSIAHLLTWFCGAYSTRFKAPVDTTPTLPWCCVVHMTFVVSCHVMSGRPWDGSSGS